MARLTDANAPLAAGDFSAWLAGLQRALRGDADSDVPCDGCSACCTSAQFVPIGPEETDTLSHIPAALQFPAPGRPDGHIVLGYDEHGHCPMLVDGLCSIYDHRPRTCRTYDCRVFAATAVEPDEDGSRALIADRVDRWTFAYPNEVDRREHEAVRAAATFVRAHRDELGEGGAAGAQPTQLALLAIDAHEAFLTGDGGASRTSVTGPNLPAVRVAIRRARRP